MDVTDGRNVESVRRAWDLSKFRSDGVPMSTFLIEQRALSCQKLKTCTRENDMAYHDASNVSPSDVVGFPDLNFRPFMLS